MRKIPQDPRPVKKEPFTVALDLPPKWRLHRTEINKKELRLDVYLEAAGETMINILNPPEYNIIHVQESVDAYRIEVEVAKPPLYCPQCGCKAHLHKHTKYGQLVFA